MSGEFNLKEAYTELNTSLAEIDEVLDSLGDQATAGKRKLTNEFIKAQESNWKPLVDQLVGQLNLAEENIQIGVYFGLIRGLSEAFSKPMTEKIEKLVAAQPEIAKPDLSADQIAELQKNRSEIYSRLKQLVEIGQQFGFGEGLEMPKRRFGAKGKRALTSYDWSIEGKQYDNLKMVAAEYDQYDGAGAITKAMREAKIDTKNPPERITFGLPDGKTLVGVKSAVEKPEDPTDDSDEDDEAEVEDQVPAT